MSSPLAPPTIDPLAPAIGMDSSETLPTLQIEPDVVEEPSRLDGMGGAPGKKAPPPRRDRSSTPHGSGSQLRPPPQATESSTKTVAEHSESAAGSVGAGSSKSVGSESELTSDVHPAPAQNRTPDEAKQARPVASVAHEIVPPHPDGPSSPDVPSKKSKAPVSPGARQKGADRESSRSPVAPATPAAPPAPPPSAAQSPHAVQPLPVETTPRPLPPPPAAERHSFKAPLPVPEPIAAPQDGPPENQPTVLDMNAGKSFAAAGSPEEQASRHQHNAQQMIELFERQLAKKPDKHRAARLHYEVARLYESPLRDLQQAAKHFESACKLVSDHLPSVRGARRVELQLKRYPSALASLEVEIKLCADAEQRALLLYEKGCLLEGHLAKKGEARDAFEQAVALSPNNPVLLKAAAHSQEQAMAWEPLVRTLEHTANALSVYPAQQAAYLAQMARVVSVRLKNPTRAIELYKAAMAADPRAPGALSALKDLLYRENRWGELVSVLEQEAVLAQDANARALAKYRIARVQGERLGNTEASLEALEEAIHLVPNDETVLGELGRLYEMTRDYAKLSSVLERWIALSTPPRVEMVTRLAQLYADELDAPERAIERYSQALAIVPGHAPAALALEELRVQRGEWRELAEMLSHQAEACSDVDERARLYCRVAELCETRLGSHEYAVLNYKKALEYQPAFAAAYKALVRLLSQARAWHDLIEVHERRLEEELSRPERIATLFKIGHLEEEALGNPGAAVNTYLRILEISPDHLEAIEALERAAERGERYPALVSGLEREASIVKDPSAQLSLLHRAATILDEKLGETERAVTKLNEILDRDAKYAPAIHSLAKLYHRDARWESLLSTYQRELGILKEATERSALLCKMAELSEVHLGTVDSAIAHYKKASQLDPKNLSAVRSLRRLLTETGQYKEVVQLIEQEIKLRQDKSAVARLWFLAGEIYENRLGQAEKALDCYTRALEQQEDYRPAADGCVRLLEQKNNYAELREKLSAEAKSAVDPLLSLQAAYREGEILRDNMKQLMPAAAAFEAVLEREPRHVGALLALERIYVQLEDRDKLARLYEAEASVLEGAGARVSAYHAWIQLLATHGENTVHDIKNAWLAILSLLPNDVHALLELEGVALTLGDGALLHQVDAKLGVSELDRQSISAYQTRLGETMEARGETAALDVYRLALEQDPENLAAARGVSRIAARLLQPDLLAYAAETEAGLLQEPGEGARLLVLAAQQLSAGGDGETAAAHLIRATEMEPESLDAADALISVLSGQGQDARLIDAIARAAAAAKSRDKKAALWLRVARLHYSLSRDTGAAIAAAKRAATEEPNNPDVQMQLADYYLVGQNWKEAATQLQELLKYNPEPRLRLKALVELTQVMAEHLDRMGPAERFAQQALELDPKHRVALALLLRIQLSQGEEEAAADTAQRLVSVSKDPVERADALTHLGRLEGERGRVPEAVAAFVEAISILGLSKTAASDFKDWLKARGKSADYRPYADALSTYLRGGGASSEQQKAAHIELAGVLARRLDEPEAAVDQLSRALSIDPADLVLRAQLAAELQKIGKPDKAAKQYMELVRAEPHQPGHWRALAACHERLLQIEQSRLMLAPLILMGQATSEERVRYQEVTPRPSALAPRSMDAAALAFIEQDLPVQGPALELLQAMAPALPKLYPPEFEKYGITKADRIPTRTNNSLRHVADRVAAAFGVEAFELYVHESKRPLISVELSDEPALFVNVNVSALNEAQQYFVFARVFANIARGLHYTDKIGIPEVGGLLAAAARQQVPDFGSDLGNSATLDQIGRRITKAMPWFSGGRLESAARGYASGNVDYPRWGRNVQITAARAAVLCADDLAAGLLLLKKDGFNDPLLQKIIAFAVSEPTAQLRRRMFATARPAR